MTDQGTRISPVARRYASALFDLASETGSAPAVEADLKSIEALLSESADLQRLVRSPAFSAEEQGKALAAVLDKAGISGLAAQGVGIMAANRRLFDLSGMIRAFAALAAKARGEVSAEVTSATPLSDGHRAALSAALADKLGSAVSLIEKVDPSLLGGLVVRVGSRMIDTSLKTKLNSIKLAMKEVG